MIYSKTPFKKKNTRIFEHLKYQLLYEFLTETQKNSIMKNNMN